MNALRWFRRSLRFHRRMHLAVAGGAALAAAVLAAALFAGDSLHRTLRRIALQRVGGAVSAVEFRGRYADAALADRLAAAAGAPVAPVLRLPATLLAVSPDGAETRLDRVQALGVDARFFALAAPVARERGPPVPERFHDGRDALPRVRAESGPAPQADGILLGRRTAAALGAAPGAVSLRVARPAPFPLDMPLGDRRDDRASRRAVRVAGVLPDAGLGRFSLVADQVPPLNAFADRRWLGAAAGVGGRADLFLSTADSARVQAALAAALEPSDLGIAVERATNGLWLVQTDRVFLDAAHVRALAAATNPAPVLTLHSLADAFAAGAGGDARETPYGFVSALTPTADPRLGVVPSGMADDEIAINAWLAEKLRVGKGDRLTLRWRRFGAGGRLEPDAAVFRLAAVLPMEACAAERLLLPRFPGLSDADRCADWDVGMPMDPEKLKDADNEAYWKTYGPTPKAYVTLNAGRLMFGTHFGPAMTARFAPEASADAIRAALCRADPSDLGLTVRPVRAEALQAAAQATDFRALFVGMACVLMAAALILTGLLASLGVGQRREEVGVLRACGFSRRAVAWLWLAESAPPLALGAALGAVAGVGGAALLVWAMNRFWRGAVGSAEIGFLLSPSSGVAAGVAALGLALAAVAWSVRRTFRVQPRDLLDGAGEEAAAGRRGTAREFVLGMLAAAAAAALLAAAGRGAPSGAAGLFFGAGFLLMVSMLVFARLALRLAGGAGSPPALGPLRAGVLNVERQRGRSLLVMVLLACGSFLAVGVLAMKQDPAADAGQPWSGSGGFGWMVETALPLPADRGDDAVQRAMDPDGAVLAFGVQPGDEASCLNLNRAGQPRLLGVDPELAAQLGAFERPKAAAPERFQEGRAAPPRVRGAAPSPAAGGRAGAPPFPDSVWSLLARPMPDDTLPALAGDLTTVQYGLRARAGVRDGTVYRYTGEDGTVWKLRLVGALPVRTGVLQGSLIVDESVLARICPSAPGHALWLARAAASAPSAAAPVGESLRRALGRSGGIVTPTGERLRLLGAVENTYLDIFLVLGGLGVALGAAGVGLVLLRNAAARRRELALLRAVGVPPRRVLAYLAAEHLYLLVAGLASGVVPALVAVQPALRSLGHGMPAAAMAAVLALMFGAGALATVAATAAAGRARLADALRGE
jgi:predicted lysophospholipase L1 biosynthesis ABC-type transport system permease subunit